MPLWLLHFLATQQQRLSPRFVRLPLVALSMVETGYHRRQHTYLEILWKAAEIEWVKVEVGFAGGKEHSSRLGPEHWRLSIANC